MEINKEIVWPILFVSFGAIAGVVIWMKYFLDKKGYEVNHNGLNTGIEIYSMYRLAYDTKNKRDKILYYFIASLVPLFFLFCFGLFMFYQSFTSKVEGVTTSNTSISSDIMLKDTKWKHQPFEAFPECVDTLVFLTKDSGYEYRCEFKMQYEFTYSIKRDTIHIEQYDYPSNMSEEKEKMYTSDYLYRKDSLEWIPNNTNGNLIITYKKLIN